MVMTYTDALKSNKTECNCTVLGKALEVAGAYLARYAKRFPYDDCNPTICHKEVNNSCRSQIRFCWYNSLLEDAMIAIGKEEEDI